MIQRCLTFAIGSALLLSWLNQPSVASELRETPARRAVQRMLPSVVNIHTEKTAEGGQTMFSSSRGRKISGMGTGIILDERGYMVTNYHVIGDVEVIRCRMADGADFEGQVVSFDRQHDLAILKVNAPRPLAIAPIGTSADLQLAESVIAIGNAFGYHDTVTIGIVSAIGRDVEVTETQSYRNLIQTDAAINPGNSGGPLINLDGEVIGINVAIRAGSQKIGFAIPIDDARQVIARLMSAEQLDQTYHGLVSKDHKTATHRHLIVDNVQLESPAARSGLQTGDIIEKVGSVPVTDA
ncbi:MAG: trypsin-like peptidase domain-containing protein, partial [Cyanobacteria bacterium]|nr:trypsin-like peptidase domain-containing protein [Cyanobacteriota bacterium]